MQPKRNPPKAPLAPPLHEDSRRRHCHKADQLLPWPWTCQFLELGDVSADVKPLESLRHSVTAALKWLRQVGQSLGSPSWDKGSLLSPKAVYMHVLSRVWLFVTPWTLPGSTVHGISQARILEWVAISFSKGSSQPRDWPRSSTLQADSLLSDPLGKPKNTGVGCLFPPPGITPASPVSPALTANSLPRAACEAYLHVFHWLTMCLREEVPGAGGHKPALWLGP